MSCTLVFIRHAHADEGDYSNDLERPLSKKGRETQQKMTEFLKSREFKPTMILCSPYRRAIETAEIISHAFHVDVEVQPALSAIDFDEDFMLNRLNPPFDNECLFLVGHDPTLASFADHLCAQENCLPAGISKSGAVLIQFDHEINQGTGHLMAYYRPDDVLSN